MLHLLYGIGIRWLSLTVIFEALSPIPVIRWCHCALFHRYPIVFISLSMVLGTCLWYCAWPEFVLFKQSCCYLYPKIATNYLYAIRLVKNDSLIDLLIFFCPFNTPYLIDLDKCHPSLSKISQETWTRLFRTTCFLQWFTNSSTVLNVMWWHKECSLA